MGGRAVPGHFVIALAQLESGGGFGDDEGGDIDLAVFPTPGLAATRIKPAVSRPMLVMNCLVPLMTHWSPSRTAEVRRAPASEPESGSVRPKAPMTPALGDGYQPLLFLFFGAKLEEFLPHHAGGHFQHGGHGGIATGQFFQAEVKPHPVPTATPHTPRGRDAHHAQIGHLFIDIIGILAGARSTSSARGAITSRAKSRAMSLIMRCSSDKSKFITFSVQSGAASGLVFRGEDKSQTFDSAFGFVGRWKEPGADL